MATFNLIREPWIPCIMLDETRRSLGLRDLLHQSHKISEISGDSPLVVAALHRLLLAILHRSLSVEDSAEWAGIWESRRFDMKMVGGYLQRWNDRFNLFDLERPFYQVAGLDPGRGGSAARLFFHQDNNLTLFAHITEAEPLELSPGEAARLLLGFMAFDVGGFKTGESGRDSARAALLNGGAVIQAKGNSLFQTLMLNLCRYAPEDDEPWSFDRDADRPAWERDEKTIAADRRPDGYLDLLTWQSRRLLLQPEIGTDGRAVVKDVVVMKGFQLPRDVSLHGMETMLAFRKNERAGRREDPWPAIRFDEDRVLWRDSLALIRSVDDQASQPKILRWLGDLAYEEIIPHSRIVPVDVLGMSSWRATVQFWRHERIPIPVAYIGDDRLADHLSGVLEVTEKTAEELRRVTWYMAKGMLGILEENPSRVQRGRLREVTDHLDAERAYWSRLEEPFKLLLERLPDDPLGEAQSWKTVLKRTVWEAFREVTRGMENSTRNLRARARAEGRLARVVNKGLRAGEDGF